MKRTSFVLGLVVILVAVLFAAAAATPMHTTGSSGLATHRVKVFFTPDSAMATDCAQVKAFHRVTVGPDVLHDALNKLLKGPWDKEVSVGANSFFSMKTAGMINSVRIDDRTAFVDFDDFRHIIPNASTSCGSAMLLAQLDRTAMQFPTVDDVVYSFEGSVRRFYAWVQLDAPRT